MLRRFLVLSTALYLACGPAAAANWQLPPDKGTFGQEGIAAILGANDYPETSGYRKKVDYIDFESHGQKFTQVVVSLTPDKPRMHKGRRIVVVGGEPGKERRLQNFLYADRIAPTGTRPRRLQVLQQVAG